MPPSDISNFRKTFLLTRKKCVPVYITPNLPETTLLYANTPAHCFTLLTAAPNLQGPRKGSPSSSASMPRHSNRGLCSYFAVTLEDLEANSALSSPIVGDGGGHSDEPTDRATGDSSSSSFLPSFPSSSSSSSSHRFMASGASLPLLPLPLSRRSG